MSDLPERELLRRGEVLRGTGWKKGWLKLFEETGKLTPYHATKTSRKLYYRCQVVKLQEEAKKGEMK